MHELVWKSPSALWLLWALPVLIGSAVLAHRGTRRAALAFAGAVMAPRLMPPLNLSEAAVQALIDAVHRTDLP